METTNRPFAVVTGASSGIGYELARVFAKNGFDLLITAENDLRTVARELQDAGAQVTTLQADLAQHDEVEKLWKAIQATGRPLEAIAINAGVGVGGGTFAETDLQAELNLIQLNVTSTIHLSKRVVRDMLSRSAGRILFTSSIAGTMPTPYQAVYGASKAFVQSLSQSLRHELKDSGITVTALQPGPTDTNFFHRAGMDDTKLGTEGKYSNNPAEVAQQGFDALMSGEDHVFASSVKTKIEGELGKFMPESLKAKMHEKQAEPKSGT